MLNELTIDTIQKLTIDELIPLYQQGYTLEENPKYNIQTMSTLTDGIIIGGLIIAGFIIYYKWLLPLRYKMESEAARKSGVKYSAVGLTGAGSSHY